MQLCYYFHWGITGGMKLLPHFASVTFIQMVRQNKTTQYSVLENAAQKGQQMNP